MVPTGGAYLLCVPRDAEITVPPVREEPSGAAPRETAVSAALSLGWHLRWSGVALGTPSGGVCSIGWCCSCPPLALVKHAKGVPALGSGLRVPLWRFR